MTELKWLNLDNWISKVKLGIWFRLQPNITMITSSRWEGDTTKSLPEQFPFFLAIRAVFRVLLIGVLPLLALIRCTGCLLTTTPPHHKRKSEMASPEERGDLIRESTSYIWSLDTIVRKETNGNVYKGCKKVTDSLIHLSISASVYLSHSSCLWVYKKMHFAVYK